MGIQVDSEDELAEIAKRLHDAEIESSPEEGASCCYAHSNKHWALDPQGIAWESFHTLGDIAVFGEDTKMDAADESSACCIPLHQGESKHGQEEAACCVPQENDATGCCA